MPYNLPGLTNIMRDNRLQVIPRGAQTESTFIVGTALDGPTEPVRVTSPQDAERVFGPFLKANGKRNGATLVPAIYEAFQAGCTNVGVLRIGGEQAKLVLKDKDEGGSPVVVAKGRFPGEKYNGITVKVTADTIEIMPKNATEPVVFDISDLDTLGELVEDINAKAADTGVVFEIAGDLDEKTPIVLAEINATPLAGGTSGINPDDATLEELLNTAFEYLTDVDMDYIVVPDATVGYNLSADPATVDFTFARMLGEFCHEASQRNRVVFGSIAVKPLSNASLANIKKLVDALIDNPTGNNLESVHVDEDGNPIDLGRYLTITVNEAMFTAPKLGTYFGPFNIAYMGFASKLAPESATTNKVIPNVRGLRYRLSAAQVDGLANAGYVTLRERFGRGIVVSDGTTAAKKTSDYTRLSTARIVKAATNLVSAELEPFLGEPGDIVAFNSMNTALEAGLSAMREAGALQDYRFQIISHPDELIRGIIRVFLDLVPAFEVRSIQTIVTLHRSLD